MYLLQLHWRQHHYRLARTRLFSLSLRPLDKQPLLAPQLLLLRLPLGTVKLQHQLIHRQSYRFTPLLPFPVHLTRLRASRPMGKLSKPEQAPCHQVAAQPPQSSIRPLRFLKLLSRLQAPRSASLLALPLRLRLRRRQLPSRALGQLLHPEAQRLQPLPEQESHLSLERLPKLNIPQLCWPLFSVPLVLLS